MITPHTHPCAIIGGGLAGITLAIQLQQAGINTILFEKETYPFHKVCGEYISMESWNFLLSCGVMLDEMALPRITNLHVTSSRGTRLSHPLSPGGFGISRFKLDAELATIARACGVTLMENCKVFGVTEQNNVQVINTSGGTFESLLAFGSWGKRSNLDTRLARHFISSPQRRLTNYVAVKYHVKADLLPHIIELHNFRNGYCGISRIEDDRYCLCYLVKGEELSRAGNNIQELERTVLMKNPFLRYYFNNVEWLYEKPLSISQVSFEKKTQAENDLLMLGDAAGLITPLCGNGMSMAMHASKLLAHEVALFFNRKQSYQELKQAYINRWQQEFTPRMRTGRFIQRLFGNEYVTDFTLRALKPFPRIMAGLVARTHGHPF